MKATPQLAVGLIIGGTLLAVVGSRAVKSPGGSKNVAVAGQALDLAGWTVATAAASGGWRWAFGFMTVWAAAATFQTAVGPNPYLGEWKGTP